MTKVLEGVKVGPLDPETTAEFGQVSQRTNARQLIRLHARMYPGNLRAALAKPLDAERTKGLDRDEVRGYVEGLRIAGPEGSEDPVLPEGARIVGATVRGNRDSDQVLTFVYELPKTGRVGKWFAPYNEDSLPSSYEKGGEYVRVSELKERGLVAWDEEGTATDVLRREASELRRQNRALREQIEARGHPGREGDGDEAEDLPAEPAGDSRPVENIAAENQELRAQANEALDRLQRLEGLLDAVPGGIEGLQQASGQPAAAEAPAAPQEAISEDEPYEGYESLKAPDAVKLAQSDDLSREDRERILDYERRQRNRQSVVQAFEQKLNSERE